MIRCIIVDDEKPAREEIKFLLSRQPIFQLVGEGENGVDAINLMNNESPDVIFCDINMPLLSGIEVARIMLEKQMKIQLIFITAYDEHAIQAFELNALDYLLKPIRDERFEQTLSKISRRLDENQSNHDALDKFVSTYPLSENKPSNLCLYRDGLLYPIKLSEITYVHKEEKMVYFYTQKGVFESNKALSEVEEILPSDDFFKCHRSYIINLNQIESVIPWFNRTYRIKPRGFEEEIPVSRSQTNKLKQLLNIL
jgi:DNA-binding LytR/AlgR family response regulator